MNEDIDYVVYRCDDEDMNKNVDKNVDKNIGYIIYMGINEYTDYIVYG